MGRSGLVKRWNGLKEGRTYEMKIGSGTFKHRGTKENDQGFVFGEFYTCW